jgi:hypothetical protein
MKKLAVCVLLSACLVGGQCYGYTAWGGFQGVEATYVPESDEVLVPKPDDYEVVVFVRGDEPDSTYRVIGHVYFDTRTYRGLSNWVTSADVSVLVLDVLKEEARKQGADALVDFNLTWGGMYAIGRAKAAVFE